MCEQCIAETEFYGEVLPGYYLTRATKDGWWLKAGDWCLVICNDPEFSFHTMPIKDPFDGMTDEQVDATSKEEMKRFDDFVEVCNTIGVEIAQSVLNKEPFWALHIYGKLYVAMEKAGFSSEKDGDPTMWLCHRIAAFIEAHPTPWKHGEVRDVPQS